MIREIQYACDFLAARHLPVPYATSPEQADVFHGTLLQLLQEKLASATWDPARPARGSGFRSLLIVGGRVDPVIAEAARAASIQGIQACFPADLTLWIDPMCVSYRTGTSDHSPIVVLWEDRVAVAAAAAASTGSPSAAFSAFASLPSRTTKVVLRNPASLEHIRYSKVAAAGSRPSSSASIHSPQAAVAPAPRVQSPPQMVDDGIIDDDGGAQAGSGLRVSGSTAPARLRSNEAPAANDR
ncbi:hypothetical protein DFJ73DRAFT_772783 [Zopfochytrium polystomum]|nr:hypothetical protein DFJ73DRAFT_772783 [Zopfochytrium polystomum]